MVVINDNIHMESQNIDYMKTIEVFKDIITKQQEMIINLINKFQESNINIMPILSGLLSDKIHVVTNPATIPFPTGPWCPNYGPQFEYDKGVNYPPPPKPPVDSSTLSQNL